MTVRPPAFQSEPQIQFLYQLVREIADGHIQVPRFQRDFVWTEDQQLELFRSIRMGTPIGCVMMWRTNRQDVRARDKLGPYILSSSSEPIRSYVIDGHQRLATLFGALHVPADGDQLPERIAYFDLNQDDFLFAPREQAADPLWLPLRYVLDFSSLLPFQRSFAGHPHEKNLVRRTDIVVTAFSTYKIPVLPVATNDLDHVTRTFQRINSQGTVMSEVHMVTALTWSKTFDLNERIAAWKEEHLAPLEYGDLDDDIVLHACKAALGFEVYERNVDKVSLALREKPETLEQTLESLIDAVMFLRDECRILSTKVLPYVAHVVPLAEALRRNRKRDQPIDKHTIVRWFWLLAYSGHRAGVSKLLAALEEMTTSEHGTQSLIRQELPLPPRFDFRNARCRVFALRLADRIPGGHELLAREGARAMALLFTDRWKVPSEEYFRSPANRILVAPNEANEVRSRIDAAILDMSNGALSEEQTSLLDRYMIPRDRDLDEPHEIHRDYFMQLVEQRKAEMEGTEGDFFSAAFMP